MVAKLGLDNRADLTGLERKGSFFKRRDHLSLDEETKIPTLLTAGAGRIPFSQSGKIGSTHQLFVQLIGFVTSCFFFIRRCFFINSDQNMTGLYSFFTLEFIDVLVIKRAAFSLRNRNFGDKFSFDKAGNQQSTAGILTQILFIHFKFFDCFFEFFFTFETRLVLSHLGVNLLFQIFKLLLGSCLIHQFRRNQLFHCLLVNSSLMFSRHRLTPQHDFYRAAQLCGIDGNSIDTRNRPLGGGRRGSSRCTLFFYIRFCGCNKTSA